MDRIFSRNANVQYALNGVGSNCDSSTFSSIPMIFSIEPADSTHAFGAGALLNIRPACTSQAGCGRWLMSLWIKYLGPTEEINFSAPRLLLYSIEFCARRHGPARSCLTRTVRWKRQGLAGPAWQLTRKCAYPSKFHMEQLPVGKK